MDSSSSSTSSLKYDWYQSDQKVVITILEKNVTQDEIDVKFESEAVTVRIRSRENNLNLNLFSAILPQKCSYKLFASKVEITLIKDGAGRWEALVKKEPAADEAASGAKATSKNWDALAKRLTDEKEDESVETLFSKIYSDGNDDQRRAMIKSFYESGGTVLSTNWNEVSKKKVEVKPPEGVEFRKWN